jgi:predicted nuclease with TOPRIM domain
MDNNTMFELADELKRLRDLKADLEAQVKDVAAQIDDTDYRLSELMAETETQNFTRAGTMFCLTTKTPRFGGGR